MSSIATATSLAKALHRLVMMMDWPVAATSSISSRQHNSSFPADILDCMRILVIVIPVEEFYRLQVERR
jgi:hypothetical protein